MCLYRRVIFSCSHSHFGMQAQPCAKQAQYDAEGGGQTCEEQTSSPMRTVRVSHKCPSCGDRDRRVAKIKANLAALKDGTAEIDSEVDGEVDSELSGDLDDEVMEEIQAPGI